MVIDNENFEAWMERIVEEVQLLRKQFDYEHSKRCVRLLDNQDVMILFKINRSSLQRMKRRGDLPFTTINGKNFYREADVHEFIRKKFENERGK